MLKTFVILSIAFAISVQESEVRNGKSQRSFDGLTQNPSKPRGSQVVFMEQGHLVNQIGFVHVKMVFKLGDVKKSIMESANRLNHTIFKENKFIEDNKKSVNSVEARVAGEAKATVAVSTSYLYVLRSVYYRITKTYFRFCDQLMALPSREEDNLASKKLYHRQDGYLRHGRDGTSSEDPNEVLSREKRGFVDFISSMLGLGGSIMGAISLAQINELYAKFGQAERNHNKLVDIVQVQGGALKDLSLDLSVMHNITQQLTSRNGAVVDAMGNVALDYVSEVRLRVEAIVEAAQSQRLSTRALSGPTLLRLFEYLLQVAEEEGYKLVLKHPSDLFQHEASYIYDAKTMDFILFVHIPMIPPDSILTLYRYAPFPIVHPSNSSVIKIVDVGVDTYLAVNENHEYRIMSTIDVNACNKKGTYFFCAGRNAIYNDLEETCLGALFIRDAKKVVENCKFNIKTPYEFVLAFGVREWLVFSPVSVTVTSKCPNKRNVSPIHLEPGQSVVKLEEGCILKLRRAVISADESFFKEMKILYTDWEGANLFTGIDADYFNRANQEMGNFVQVYDSKDLQNLKTNLSETSLLSSYLPILIPVLVAIVLIVISAIVTWCFCKYKKEICFSSNLLKNPNSPDGQKSSESEINFLKHQINRLNNEIESRGQFNGKTQEFSGFVEEKRSFLLNDPNPRPFFKPKPTASIAPKKDEGLRKRHFLMEPEYGNLKSISVSSDRKNSSKIYPAFGKNDKNCYIKKAVISKYGKRMFYCTSHDEVKGCSGVFLGDPVTSVSKEVLDRI